MKRLKKALSQKNSKYIAVTTNDHSDMSRKLYDTVDEVLILDTTADHQETYEILKKNLGDKLPY